METKTSKWSQCYDRLLSYRYCPISRLVITYFFRPSLIHLVRNYSNEITSSAVLATNFNHRMTTIYQNHFSIVVNPYTINAVHTAFTYTFISVYKKYDTTSMDDTI